MNIDVHGESNSDQCDAANEETKILSLLEYATTDRTDTAKCHVDYSSEAENLSPCYDNEAGQNQSEINVAG
jgi:hypothetical protein